MEQLQRLAEVIAEIYIRDLRRETGGNSITVDGVSGNVEKHLLTSGLMDNTISAARSTCGAAFEREAYKMLMAFISFDGPEYRLTEHGVHVINTMHTLALKKKSVMTIH
ncbi:hypothetical protein LG71_03500 [Pluralibacter gergoviae]|uniref:hypothetical protein n=1 Tax=Pluralibacter gergoviae TaxID=61647 RepID=UPI0004F7E3AB|nr:hypothetical protein [Pluralibacter gergoviae]AIQ99028.1 hypothetical protein LG71_03500 [Pluralibacter gergoviae]MCV7757222.1 hypothetical protein [Pluralibacter gergoviae]